jgi:endonuclease-3
MNPVKRRAIFERLRSANPDPRTELDYGTPFELLVAVVLSAQATDKSVNKATERLFRTANTPDAIVRLGVDGLIPYISSIGLYRNKAKNVVALADALLREHAGEVPASFEELHKLPGVGRKSANVVLNVAFRQPVIPVDTHIFRVSNRTNLAPGKDPDEVADRLEKFVPDEFKLDAHHWLILHGRYVCVARKPLCPQCVIRDLCEYRDKTAPEELPEALAAAQRQQATGVPGAAPARAAAATPRARPLARSVKLDAAKPPRGRRQPELKTARAGTQRGRKR